MKVLGQIYDDHDDAVLTHVLAILACEELGTPILGAASSRHPCMAFNDRAG